MDYGSAEFRRWCIDHAAAIQLGVSFSGDVAGAPMAFLTPIPESMLPFSSWVAELFMRAGVSEISRKCVETRHNFQWRCSLADVAKACTAWPDDIVPRVYASADKAFTIEINKRKHSQAVQMGEAQQAALGAMNAQMDAMKAGADAAQGGLELAGNALDLAVKKLRVASALIEALRNDLLAILKGSRPLCPDTIDLLAQWDKLKGK